MVIYLLMYENGETDQILYASTNEAKMDELAKELNSDKAYKGFYVYSIDNWSEDFDVEETAEYFRKLYAYL
jgi:hypothetical protein